MTAAIAVSLAVLVFLKPSINGRLRRLDAPKTARSPDSWLKLLLPIAGFAIAGPLGLIVGLVALPVARNALRRTETREDRETRLKFEKEIPLALDLVASIVEVGAPVSGACRLVADHVDEIMRQPLLALADRLDHQAVAGEDPFSNDPNWQSVTRSLIRSQDSGASVSGTLERVAEDARRAYAARRSADAQRVTVRTAGPLGACFLPAFMLIGVVPGILSLVLVHMT